MTAPRRAGPALWVLLGLGGTGGLALLLALVFVGGGGGAGPSERPKEIALTFPNPGDQILAQGEVGAQVPQGWSFELSIDAIPIPRDQLEVIDPLGIYKFRPRAGRVIPELPRGERRATVTTSPPGGGPPVVYTWTFRVGP